MTTSTHQLIQPTGDMHPVNQGVVSLHSNWQHLLVILQEAAAGADQRDGALGRCVGVLDARETQPRHMGQKEPIVETASDWQWLGSRAAQDHPDQSWSAVSWMN